MSPSVKLSSCCAALFVGVVVMNGVANAQVVVPPATDEQPDEQPDEGVPPAVETPGTEPRLIEPRLPDSGGDLPREGHSGQGGLALALPLGLRTIAPFDSEYCGKNSTETGSGNAAVCVDRAPVAIDLALSYGLGDKLELLVEFRLGLESDFSSVAGRSGPKLLRLSPGARIFYSKAGPGSLFSTAQIVFDFTAHEAPSGRPLGNDFGVRNANGLWFDRGEHVGLFVFVAESLTFVRWIELGLEIGVGIQGRLP